MLTSPVLITGGAGFIGSHLTDALLSRGYAVRVFDNLSTGKRANLPLSNPRLELIVGDVADNLALSHAVVGCGAVVHLAAVASVQASVEEPLITHHSNFIGTLNLCEAMLRNKIKRVVFASSAAVYGSGGEGVAIREDADKMPLTPYASDKLSSEHYLDFYRRQHALEPVIFRFFNIFGPRQDPSSPYSGVISIFSEQARNNLPITVYGDGEQTRDFFYVEDLVHVLIQAIESHDVQVGAINCGFNKTITLNQILLIVAELTGNRLDVSYAAARSGDIRHSRADNTRLLSHFIVPEQTSMRVGLARLLSQ